MKNKNKIFDVVIIGGGAAGISAALWCVELGLSTVMLEKNGELGGQLLRVYNPIENHLGSVAANGRELRDIFAKQIANRNFLRHLNAEVISINFHEKSVLLKTGETFCWQFLIIAAGVRRRKLNVEGENEFSGRGILNSGKNESRTAAGQTVAVIGGGDAALENALILAETAKKVLLVHRRARFRGRAEFVEKVGREPKIKTFLETTIEKIGGSEKVELIEIKNLRTGATEILPVDNILVRIGVEPNTEIVGDDLKADQNGYLQVDQFCETNFANVFAVGDVANLISPTVSTAAGMGATAAKMIRHRLKN